MSAEQTTAGSVHVVCPHCGVTNRLPAAKLGAGGKCGSCGGRLFDGQPMPLTAARFAQYARHDDLPLLMDFWAAWCGPCRAMAPVFAEAAAHLEPRLRLAKVDTEAEPALSAQFAVRSIPTLVLTQRGREVARQSGAMALPHLLDWANKQLQGLGR